MTLRAKKPEVRTSPRVKGVLFGDPGAGKTNFCCSIPYTYYIDTEKLEDYPHFVEMIQKNNGVLVRLTELTDIIQEVKELLTVKHDYKTLVIDSASFPANWLSLLEIDRLKEASDKPIEGTEYGANKAKSAQLIQFLGFLLIRLDMNVFVTAHETVEYEKDVEIGKKPDIDKKLGFALGTILQLRRQGRSRKLFMKKSRYPQLPDGTTIDFDNGFEVFKERFGDEVFSKESRPEVLATEAQIKEFMRLTTLLHIEQETQQKWFIKAEASGIADMTMEHAQKCIDHMLSKIKGE